VNAFLARRPWVPYVVPMAVYLAYLQVQGRAPGGLEIWYPVKALLVAGLLWAFRQHYGELRGRCSLLAVVTGLVAIVIWIAIDPFYPKQSDLFHQFAAFANRLVGVPPPTRAVTPPFDPHTLGSAARLWTFVGFRVFGAVVVVPVMEELFWRGFLIRWLAADDFRSVPVGTYTPASFWITVGLFGMIHEQWLAGVVCGAFYNLLLYRTKSLTACVIAHAVSNAALAGWVLARGDWKFW
jgi:membrane protease YdiL (CAAX protease family)